LPKFKLKEVWTVADQRQEYYAGGARGDRVTHTMHQWCKLVAEQGEQAFADIRLRRERNCAALSGRWKSCGGRATVKKIVHLYSRMSDEVSLHCSASTGADSKTRCQLLEVSVKGESVWKRRPASTRQIADERLSARIWQHSSGLRKSKHSSRTDGAEGFMRAQTGSTTHQASARNQRAATPPTSGHNQEPAQ
jgi:hypothetical protein